MMYSYRGRIGLVVLDSDLNMEPEARRIIPDGVEIHVARVKYPHEMTPESLQIAAERLDGAVESLVPVKPAVITYACTSSSFAGGIEGNNKILERMRKAASSIPVSTTSGAVVKALKKLGLKNPSVGSPYIEELNLRLVEFLRAHGIEVVKIKSMYDPENPVDDFEFQSVDDQVIYEFVKSLQDKKADGIFISCTGMPVLNSVERLERELGVPVISSNIATIWEALTIAGVYEAKPATGSLLAKLSG